MNGLDLACDLGRRFEGIEDGDEIKPGLQPYRDPIGYWTIGYGHLISRDRTIPMPDMTWTMEQAEADLRRVMSKHYISAVNLAGVYLDEGQAAALADFSYNLGVGALKSSTLLRKVRRGDFNGAADEFPKWKFAGGRILNGLIRRRAAERDLWMGAA